MGSRHSNLSNPNGEPEHAPLEVSCMIHFDQYQGGFPRTKLIRWLESLPENAKIKFSHVSRGKPHFEATWKEER